MCLLSWKQFCAISIVALLFFSPIGILLAAILSDAAEEIETDAMNIFNKYGGEVENYIPTLKAQKIESSIESSRDILNCSCYDFSTILEKSREKTFSYYDIDKKDAIAIKYDRNKVKLLWNIKRKANQEKGFTFTFSYGEWNRNKCVNPGTVESTGPLKKRVGKHQFFKTPFILEVYDNYLFECTGCTMGYIQSKC